MHNQVIPPLLAECRANQLNMFGLHVYVRAVSMRSLNQQTQVKHCVSLFNVFTANAVFKLPACVFGQLNHKII